MCFRLHIINQVHALVFLIDVIFIGKITIVSILFSRKADQIVTGVTIVNLGGTNEESITELTIELVASSLVTFLSLLLVPIEELHLCVTCCFVSKRNGVVAIDPVIGQTSLISPVEQVAIVLILRDSLGTKTSQLLLGHLISFIWIALFIYGELVLALLFG
jgi:hypothetical protein